MSITYITGRFRVDAVPSEERGTSDAALIQSIATGDKHAMRLLFARHNVRVYRFLLRFVANEATAEDLASEVFLDVWRQAGKFQARSQVSTWLLAIARYKALALLRRRSTKELDEEQAGAIEDPAPSPEVMIENRQKTEILRKCLAQLSPTHREVIDLVYYHEKSIDEVAEITGVPQNTVKTRMFYARKRIFYARKRIADLMNEQGITRATL